MLRNRYGHFDPSGRAFHITDSATPAPWSNVISNGHYGIVLTHNGGGFSFLDDAQHNVLTRWEMDLVRDCSGKFLYCTDLDSGKLWSLAPAPCRPAYDSYECIHTLGASTFKTRCDGIDAEWTLAVASADNVEVWLVKLTNVTDRPRRLRIASAMEWCCGVAPDSKREFHKLFFTTHYDAKRRAAVATKNMWDIPSKLERDHWNKPWPYVAAHAVSGVRFDREIAVGDKAAFLGRYGSFTAPQALARPPAEPVGFGRFSDSMAALGGELTIPARGSATLHFVIAVSPTEAETLALVDKYSDANTARSAVDSATKSWLDRLAPTQVESEQADFDLLNNFWLPYQAISGRMWARTGVYQQSGARGFRDQLQDSQVWLPLEPSRTGDQIMLHATRQFVDGSVNHWWHALADFGNHTACSDDYLWLPFLVAQYIKETGDQPILARTAPFMDDARGGTILDHCTRAIARTFARTSERGLPFIGACDWNDGLSAMGLEERGESVWLAMFLCQILADWTIIAKRAGATTLSDQYAAKRTEYAAAINTHAWDGSWYRGATKDSGQWIGSSSCAEGKIHLNPQTWAVLADIAPVARAKSAWQSVKNDLLTPYGPLLLSPAYTTPDPDIGYITRYSPGSRENGGVYMHAATWALAAAAKLRDVDAVASIWHSISPPTRGQDAEAYWAEPFVTPGNVDGPLSEKPGRAGWTWYTGSAAWLNRVSMEWILGIRPVWTEAGEGLMIDPCPPTQLGRVSVQRTWRGVPVRVRFDATTFAGGAPVLTVNGTVLSGCVLPSSAVQGVKAVEVEVTWAAKAAGEAQAIESKLGQAGKVKS